MTKAMRIPQKMTRRWSWWGKAGGGEADDDGIVAGEHDVDEDDGQEGLELGEFEHGRGVPRPR